MTNSGGEKVGRPSVGAPVVGKVLLKGQTTICAGLLPNGGAAHGGTPLQISSSSNRFGLEEKPKSELDVTRLVEIGVASRHAEGKKIIEIQGR